MSRPVFSFRPNPNIPEHRRAWEILCQIPDGSKNQYLVNCILGRADEQRLKEIVREAVHEELMGGSTKRIIEQKPEEIPEQMMEFLFQMEQE